MQNFHGWVDEVAVYDVALSEAQVQLALATPLTEAAGVRVKPAPKCGSGQLAAQRYQEADVDALVQEVLQNGLREPGGYAAASAAA